jgi:hypothetical protein
MRVVGTKLFQVLSLGLAGVLQDHNFVVGLVLLSNTLETNL